MKWKITGTALVTVIMAVLVLPFFIQSGSEGLSQNCISEGEITSSLTPVELYTSLPFCLIEGRYESAAYLHKVAFAFGRFDTYRVPDTSAHQSIPAMRLAVLSQIDPEKIPAFQEAIDRLNDDEGSKQTYCQRLKSIGKPTYHPEYMIQHGMAALSGEEKIASIDEDAAWAAVLSEYSKCA